jgi:hypothetical protein
MRIGSESIGAVILLGHVQWCLMWRLLRCLRGVFAKKS